MARPVPVPPTPAAKPSAEAALSAGPASGEETVCLPLKAILSRLPASLSALVKSGGNGEVAISLKKIMAQLPQGAVKVTFGELRQASPAGTFLEVASQDQTLVELPLPDILSRINPALLQRRAPQRTLDAPAEVGNLFGPRGEKLVQPEASAPAPRAPLPPGPATRVPPPAPSAAPSAPRPASMPTSVPRPAMPLPKPVAPPAAPKPAPAPSAVPTSKPPTPVVPKIAPVAPPAPAAPKVSPLPTSAPLPKPAPKIAPVAPVAAPTAAAAEHTQYFLKQDTMPSAEALMVPLANLTEGWPEAVLEEIKKLDLQKCSVALPMNQLEVSLRSGKIVFPWKQLASWIKPGAPPITAQGDTPLELPLKVIAPLFIAQHRPAKSQKRVTIGENIPDIFSGGALVKPAESLTATAGAAAPAVPATQPKTAPPAPTTPPAVAPRSPAPAVRPVSPPPAAPAPAAPRLPTIPKPPVPATPAAPKPAAIPAASVAAPAPLAPVSVVAKEPATMGEVFGEPGKKEWPPNEIVQKTAAIKGMSGALIATNDGLLVAGHLPAPLKPETVGAFLPQMFTRMNQYGKELQLGELNALQVEFNKVPWYVVKLGHIYFAAVGKAGETFPISLVKVISNELGKPTK